MSAEREQLLDQVANVIRVIGDSLDQKPEFNELVSISKCLYGMREGSLLLYVIIMEVTFCLWVKIIMLKLMYDSLKNKIVRIKGSSPEHKNFLLPFTR